jgi:hypothetical protein
VEKEDILPESQDYANIQTYHGQLWIELLTLFRLLHGLCKKHQAEAESAVARAILFTLFGTMETASRVLATSALLSNAFLEQGKTSPKDSPQPVAPLTSAEKMFLRQESEDVDRHTWSVRQISKFISFEDALLGYPQIYARHFGTNISIDTSRSEWECIKRMKRLRDLGAHGNIKSGAKPYVVTYTDLMELLMARKWYCEQLEILPWIAGSEAAGEIKVINLLLKELPHAAKKK